MDNKKGASPQPKSASEPVVGPENPDSPVVNWDEQTDFLRALAHIVKEERLSELSVESGGVRLQFKGAAPGVRMAAVPATASENASAKGESGAVAVVSPMVGVFYRSPSPSDPPFVEVGDTVQAGQVIGVVEAMKVFNEIISDIEGTVVEIIAQNAELVETGAPLVMVRK